MKLRNKKNGEIGNLRQWWDRKNRNINGVGVYVSPDEPLKQYNSLAELNEEWEDYEEPKEYWFIDFNGEIKEFEVLGFEWQGWMREIGNYFETKEEALKAVECLRAWKRLKDNGFKFQFWTSSYSGDNISFFIDWINADSKKEIEKDLDLLFGGEE